MLRAAGMGASDGFYGGVIFRTKGNFISCLNGRSVTGCQLR